MNLFKGIQSMLFTNEGEFHEIFETRVYVWNIPAGSTSVNDKGVKVSKTTARAIESTCRRLDAEETDRYMIFNFSPLMMELVDACHHGQVLDYSKQSVENFALLLEVCFTMHKWISAGPEPRDHCVIMAFLEEADAVQHPNYAAMMASCYLIFIGFPSNDGRGMLSFVEKGINIRRSVYHAPSQESYVNYFQLLFEIPVLPNTKRLRLLRISLHNFPNLLERKLGLQLETSDGPPLLLSDPTAWRPGEDPATEAFLPIHRSVLGDFAIHVMEYTVGSVEGPQLGGGPASSFGADRDRRLSGGSFSSTTYPTLGGSSPLVRKSIVHKRRLFRLAFSTVFIHQQTHRVRVREMDYASTNSLPDDLCAKLHFSDVASDPMDDDYMCQVTERVEKSPRRQLILARPDPRLPMAMGALGGGGGGSGGRGRSSSRFGVRHGAAEEEELQGGVYYHSDGTTRGGSAAAVRWESAQPLTGATRLRLPSSLHMIAEEVRRFDDEDDVAEEAGIVASVTGRTSWALRPPREPTPERMYGGGVPLSVDGLVDVDPDEAGVGKAGLPGGAPPPPPPKPQGPKMKTIFWKKVAKPTGVWSVYPDEDARRVMVDEAFLRALFEVRPPTAAAMAAAKRKAAAAASNRLQRSNVLTGQQLQNTGIALKRVQLTVTQACEALVCCDAVRLDAARREMLLMAIPGPESIVALGQEKKSGRFHWTDVEDFLYTLCTTVKDVRERLQLWNAADELGEAVEIARERLDAIEGAVRGLSAKNGRFARVLRRVLALGNFLNRGTPYGDAVGFRLENLSQLNFIKSADGKTSVLEVVVVTLLEEEPEVLAFTDDLAEGLSKVASTTLLEVGQQVTQLGFLLQRMRKVVEESADEKAWYEKRLPTLERDDPTSKDALPTVLARAVEAYMAVASQLALRHQELRDDLAALLESYGEDASLEETVLWGYAAQFVKDVQECVTRVTAARLTRKQLQDARTDKEDVAGADAGGDAASTATATTAPALSETAAKRHGGEVPPVPPSGSAGARGATGLGGVRPPRVALTCDDDESD